MAIAISQLGTTHCYASAIHLLFLNLCSVQSYFNNGLRFVWENASQPQEQTSLFRRARHIFIQTSVPKSYGISRADRYKRKQERTLVKITCTCDAKINGQEHWILCRCLECQKSVLFVHCDSDILASSNGHIVPDYNDN
jgi:hypothetical protein